MPVKIFQYSFRVFPCACPTVISSISGKSFHFPFPYFVLCAFNSNSFIKLCVFFEQETVLCYLNELCPYFEMLRELRCFGKDLSTSDKPPPLTYLTYWNEVEEFLTELITFLVEIERKVKKQGECSTTFSVFNVRVKFSPGPEFEPRSTALHVGALTN